MAGTSCGPVEFAAASSDDGLVEIAISAPWLERPVEQPEGDPVRDLRRCVAQRNAERAAARAAAEPDPSAELPELEVFDCWKGREPDWWAAFEARVETLEIKGLKKRNLLIRDFADRAGGFVPSGTGSRSGFGRRGSRRPWSIPSSRRASWLAGSRTERASFSRSRASTGS